MGWWGCAVLGDAEPQMPLSRRAGMRLQAADGKWGWADPRRQGCGCWGCGVASCRGWRRLLSCPFWGIFLQ